MPIVVQWYDEKQRILIYLVERRWTPTDILTALDTVQGLRQGTQMPLHHILDFTASERVPLGLLSIYGEIVHRLQGNYELTVIVNADQWLRILINSFVQLALPLNLYFVQSLDEALEIVRQNR